MKRVLLYFLVTFFALCSILYARQGQVTGKVTYRQTGEALVGANVFLQGTSLGAATNSDGEYTIANVPAGSYELVVEFIGYTKQSQTVVVSDDQTVMVNFQLDQESLMLGDVIVYGVSRHAERITEAPSAISIISKADIRQIASTGQLPRLFEAEPGVDVTQNGMNDFNLNTRGFNSSLNRRVLVLLDNRQTSIAFLGAQEWNALSFPMADIGRLEIVRGPGSALYGANAFAGVINITTPAPKEIVGTKLSISGGELSSFRGDLRHAGVSGAMSYKLNLGYNRSDTWSKARNISADEIAAQEYEGLTSEMIALYDDPLQSIYGTARMDYDFAKGAVATLEGGFAEVQNQDFVTGLGRVQVDKARRPWARAAFSSEHFFFQADYNGRKTIDDHQLSLNSGAAFKETSSIINFQFQHNLATADEKLRFIWGASQQFQHVDTELTLTPDVYDENQTGVFAQLEYKLSSMLKLVGAGRYDRSTLHDPQFSPKLALVLSPSVNHSFRATVNRAFQTPNFSEWFLYAPAGAPIDLAPLEAGIEAAIGGTDLPLNFGQTPILALGNNDLEVEKVTGYEIGYKGIFGSKVYFTADVYFNQLTNFITDLLPGVNPAYPAYSLPASIPEAYAPTIMGAIQGALGANFPLFSLLPDGSPALIVSYANEGEVDEYGVEIGLNYYINDQLMLSGNYTHFSFDVKSQAAGDKLIPNTPKFKFNVGLSYQGNNGIDLGVRLKHVDGYDWAAGIFSGTIPAYTLVNVAAGYQVSPQLRLGVTITNALNNEHYQIFGGSVLGRRALGSVTFEF